MQGKYSVRNILEYFYEYFFSGLHALYDSLECRIPHSHSYEQICFLRRVSSEKNRLSPSLSVSGGSMSVILTC